MHYQTKYQKKLDVYGLNGGEKGIPISGVRAYLTTDTVAQEEITNSFSQNSLEQTINSFSSKFTQYNTYI